MHSASDVLTIMSVRETMHIYISIYLFIYFAVLENIWI